MAMLDLSGYHKFESDINVYNFGGAKVVQGYRCESGIVITLTVCKIYFGTEETPQRGVFIHGKLEVLQLNVKLFFVGIWNLKK